MLSWLSGLLPSPQDDAAEIMWNHILPLYILHVGRAAAPAYEQFV